MKFGKQKKNEVVKKEEKSFLVKNKKNIKDIIYYLTNKVKK